MQLQFISLLAYIARLSENKLTIKINTMKTLTVNLTWMLVMVTAVFSQAQNANIHNGSLDDTSIPESKSFTGIYSGSTFKTQFIPPVISFTEHPVNHNMHITADGDFYFTINGGSASSGQINKFTFTGTLIQTYPIQIDGRGLSYNQADGSLYASTYMGDIVKITDLSAGTFSVIFSGIMQNGQASFAISTDGTRLYDFYQGTLEIHDFATGALLNTITGLSYGPGNFGGEAAVAVDSAHIYTMNASIKTVYSYDHSGSLLQTTVLDSGDNGISLSVANNYLFVAKDGNYATGTWYGYHLSGTTAVTELVNHNEFNVFPSPANDIITIETDESLLGASYIISDQSGRQVLSGNINIENTTVDISRLTRGIYTLQVGQKSKRAFKVVKD